MDPRVGTEPGDARTRDDGSLRALMDAVLSVSSELELTTVLERLVIVACRLTGARYGALGVVDHGELSAFVNHGMDDRTRRQIGHLPRGHGVLGHLIEVPEPLRLHDLSTHPTSVGFPPHHPPLRTFLGVPVRARGAVFGNLYLTEKWTAQTGAGDFTAEDEEVVLALAAAAGVAIDHSHAYARVREHERWLEAADACTSALTRDAGMDQGATLVVARAVAVAAAHDGLLLTRRSDVPDALVPYAVEATRPHLVPTAHGAPTAVSGPAWLLAVPLHSAERWVGALLLGWRRDDALPRPAVDLGIIAGFAEQLALALDVAAAQADRARLAVLEERERIARDLHDMVIQRLFAVGLNVQGVAQDDVPAGAAARLDRAVDELDETIKDIRTAIFRLGTRSAGQAGGLRSRIDAEILEAREHLGFLPRLRIDGITAAVPADVADDAVAVVREALANTARHAEARSAVVQIDVGADLVLTVSDDGIGPPRTLTRRSGIANADARARRHGGVLELTTGASGGMALTWSVPLES
jgi:signal transduction histidine kinase